MASGRGASRLNPARATVISALVAAISAMAVAYFGSQSAVNNRTSELDALRAEASDLRGKVSAAEKVAQEISKVKGDVSALNNDLFLVKEEMKALPLGIGEPKSLKLNADNVAPSGGLVLAWATAHQKPQVVTLYGMTTMPGEAPVRRTVAHLRVNSETNSAHIIFPVRRGEHWKVETNSDTDAGLKGSEVWFYPLGR